MSCQLCGEAGGSASGLCARRVWASVLFLCGCQTIRCGLTHVCVVAEERGGLRCAEVRREALWEIHMG